MAAVGAIMDEIYLWSSAKDNAIMHASGHYPADKIEERIIFALIHARLYLSESDDEWDDNSAAANTFDISCGGGGYSSSLLTITVSALATSDVYISWIFTSYRFLQNDPLSSNVMVDWYNDSMLGIGGGYEYLWRVVCVTQLVIMMNQHYGMLL